MFRNSGETVQKVLNLVYSPRCYNCGVSLGAFDNQILCSECRKRIRLNTPSFCKKCGASVDIGLSSCPNCRNGAYAFDGAYSACIYEGVVKECIHNFKYSSRLRVKHLFWQLMNDFAVNHIELKNIDLIACVPLHRAKFKERTFNQSEILGAGLSKSLGIPLMKNNLVRIRPGEPQIALDRNKRFEDIKGSFKLLRPSAVKERSFLLVDDVFTTGATADACAKVLKKAGADSVTVFTLAKSA